MAAPAGTSFFQSLADLKRNGARAPCWMLMSDDTLMVSMLTHALRDAVVPRHRDFNYQVHGCTGETGAGTCIALCEELPMMAERRLVWLRDVHALADGHRARLAAYLPELSPTTVLVVTGSSKAEAAAPARSGGDAARGEEDKKDATAGLKALRDAVHARGVLVSGQLGEDELLRWLEAEFKRRGLSADRALQRTFLERVHADLSTLDSELEKLTCYLGGRGKVEARDVDAVTTTTPTVQTFEFSKAVANGKTADALHLVATLVERDMHPLQILGYLGAHFRGLLKVRALMDRRLGPAEISRHVGKSEWAVKQDVAVARRFTTDELNGALDAALRADQAMKKGRDPRLVLELLTLHLCRQPGR